MAVDIRIATVADLDEVSSILTEAFTHDPLIAWIFADEQSRPRRSAGSYRYLAEHGYLPHGASQIVDGRAAALWLPAGQDGDEHLGARFWVEHHAGYAAAVEGEIARGLELNELVAPHVPTDPHRYLFTIGVRRAGQSQGLGGAMLDHALEAADAAGEAAYLESTTPRSRALYERHGFEATGAIELPDGPTLWPMWRPPAT
ncbi:MAG: GNAT family N-acetyltransferase [Actinomycetota bacterium]